MSSTPYARSGSGADLASLDPQAAVLTAPWTAVAPHGPGAGADQVRRPRLDLWLSPLAPEDLQASPPSRLLREWHELFAAVPGALPFQTPEWCLAWWGRFKVGHGLRRDSLHLLQWREQGRLVGLLPLVRSGFGPFGRPWVNAWRPLGADPNLTELRSPLVRAGHEHELADTWLDWAEAQGLGLHQLLLPSAAWQQAALRQRRLARIAEREIFNSRLEPGADWPRFKSGLKRNIKESLRRCYNSLAREGLSARLEVIGEAHELRRRLPDFYRLHSLRADRNDTVNHPDYFKSLVHRGLIEDLLGVPQQAHMALRLFVLWVAERPVAMRLGFLNHEQLYLYYSGYEPEWGRYSVMTTLQAEILQWAMGEGLTRVNLSTGRDVSKTRWSPEEAAYREVYLASGSGLGRRLLTGLTRLARPARATPRVGVADAPGQVRR